MKEEEDEKKNAESEITNDSNPVCDEQFNTTKILNHK
jgi:hypothetical protein